MICIVIAVHNRKKYTYNCLESLKKQSYTQFNIIVVDDGSTDGTADMIQKFFPEVDLIYGDGSLFWSGATNLAIKRAIEKYNPKYIITFNDDTEADQYFIENLHNAAISNHNAIIGGAAYDIQNKGLLLYDGGKINWLTSSLTNYKDMDSRKNSSTLFEVDYYPGRGLLIPVEVFNNIGYYDAEMFPQSWADNDLVLKAKKKGYKVFCNHQAKLYIYNNESKHIFLKNEKSIRNYYKYLFVQKGGGNIVLYSKFAFRHCPIFYLIPCVTIGIISRVFGYFKPPKKIFL